MAHTVWLPDIAATEQLAQKLAPILVQGDVIALKGYLGAGKTTFARALLQSLGVGDAVPSPTFSLMQSYETRAGRVCHFDLYRLRHESELDELGWDDALSDGITIVEWPEHAAAALPEERLNLHFMEDDKHQRSCKLEAHGLWQQRLKDIL